MNTINNFTIGADPELFLQENDKIISAEGIIGGTKIKPKKVSEEGHFIQEDNVMIEFNIPPCNSKDKFVEEINYMKEYLDSYVKLINKNYNINLSTSNIFDPKVLNTEQARQFGCDPDFNVYLKDINQPPDADSNIRCCGGHLHIGYDNPNEKTTENIIYALDIMLGLDSVLLDNDKLRKQMYGKAGSFRFKPYGLEYRTLSNFWIQDNLLIKWVYDRVESAINLVNSGLLPKILKQYEFDIRNAIDHSNVEKSIEIYSNIQKVLENNNIKIVN